MQLNEILQRLPTKFDYVVAVVEEAKDLTTVSINELTGSLQAHEQRINW